MDRSPNVTRRPIAVSVETGKRRVFVGALDWPGWCRSGRDEAEALEALVAYAPRYRSAVGRTGFRIPSSVSDLLVAERLAGNATTDFGAPGAVPAADHAELDTAGLRAHLRILRAAWRAFDRAAAAAEGIELTKGPRGGGRDVDAIVAHVHEADHAYLAKLWRARPRGSGDAGAESRALRADIERALTARARGEMPPVGRRRSEPSPPRYLVRRSAWHALDHAWEIEDRANLGSASP